MLIDELFCPVQNTKKASKNTEKDCTHRVPCDGLILLIPLYVTSLKHSNIGLAYMGNDERPRHRCPSQWMPNRPRLDHEIPSLWLKSTPSLHTYISSSRSWPTTRLAHFTPAVIVFTFLLCLQMCSIFLVPIKSDVSTLFVAMAFDPEVLINDFPVRGWYRFTQHVQQAIHA